MVHNNGIMQNALILDQWGVVKKSQLLCEAAADKSASSDDTEKCCSNKLYRYQECHLKKSGI
jgi:hypothetical protein